MFTYQEVYEATKEYFFGNELLTSIWLSKYTLKDKQNNYFELTPDERVKLIAKELTRIEKSFNQIDKERSLDFEENSFYERTYKLLKDFNYFIPAGSILYGVGNSHFLSSLGNCFVIGNDTDSYGSICMIDQEQVQLMKRRGGVGHDLSHLRQKGKPVNGCANTSTGSVSFAPRYSNSTREVAQDGRRGALMLTHHINHPDIEDFIVLKDDTRDVTGANISVKLTDEFMESVINDKNHHFHFPIDDESTDYGSKSSREIFNKLVHQAWKNGEPGVLFWDKIIKESPADCYPYFQTKSTNPCGELPLSPYDSCRLGHINLFAYVKNPFTSLSYFDWENFESDVQFIQRLMDNIIELEREKVEEIISQVKSSYDDESVKMTELSLWKKVHESLLKGRRTGLGVMGEADMFAGLGFSYDSPEAFEMGVEVHRRLALCSYMSSITLAEERGSFLVFSHKLEENNPFIQRIKRGLTPEWVEKYLKFGRRNISNLTVAPTGTTSQIVNRMGVSSGMEPVFEVFYKRRRKINPNDPQVRVDFVDEVGDKWEEYFVIHPTFKMWVKITHPEILTLEGLTEERLTELVKESPYNKCTANEIDVISKIKFQGEIQKWVDHSISVTHNLPKTITEEEISNIIIEAWRSGCKGFTVYREGSRAGVLVRKTKGDEESEPFHYIDAQKRSGILNCEIHRLLSKGEYWFVLVGLLNSKPYEIFAIKEKKLPSCLRIASSAVLKGQIIKRKKRLYDLITVRPDTGEPIIITDILSLMDSDDDRSDTKRFSLELRHRINPKFISETIDKQPKEITSFEKAITRVLKRYIVDGEVSGLVCDNCGSSNVFYVNGCPKCRDCGISKCG